MISQIALKEVESVEITCLIDNTVDFMSTIVKKEVKRVREWVNDRMDEEWVKKNFQLPFAEKGFSVLIRVICDRKFHTVLFDAGISLEGVVTNAKRMGLNLKEVECIILSHGHYDHFGGLLKVLEAVEKENLPIIVHEHMFRTRGVVNSDGTIRKYPEIPSENKVAPAKYVKTKQACLLADESILVTGEIPRNTDFEKGLPRQRFLSNGQWQPDPRIWDERAIAINVKHKGLVVLSGCAHAGIINTIRHAQQTTGVTEVYAIIGGFHLAGRNCEPRISQTVEMLRKFNPKIVVPMHCTGWRGKYAIFEGMPQAFIWNSVGNHYCL